jgi:DNA modification methylase
VAGQLLVGDAKELSKDIPDGSIDLIFTDPPYLKEYLHLYEWLAEEAARVLKPGGFVLAMCGGLYVNQIFRMFDQHLHFFWKYEVILRGWATGIVWTAVQPKTTIVVRSKPLIAYSKGPSTSRTSTMGTFDGTGSDKRYHAWGQDEASARYYVDCFSAIGDTVYDPFCGGGTTPYVCEQLGRNWIAHEIDPLAGEKSRQRLANVQMPLELDSAEQSQMEIA